MNVRQHNMVKSYDYDFKQNTYILLCILSICMLIILRDIKHIAINKAIFLALFGVFFILLKSKNIISVIVFFIPFYNGLPGNWILLMAILFFIIKEDFSISMKKILLPLLVLFSELAHTFLYNSTVYVLMDIIKYLTFITIISFIVFDNKIKINYKKTLRLFTIGVILMCFIILFTTFEYYSIDTIFSGNFRFGDLTFENNIQSMILSNNQNNIGYYCMLSIVILLILNYVESNKTIINWISISVLFFFGLLTMSRAFILTSISAIILFYLFSIRGVKSSFKNIFIVVLFVIVGFMIANYFLPDMIEGLFERLSEADGFGGRSGIYEKYNIFLKSNLLYMLLGTGLLGINEVSKISSVPHNGLQQILVSYGIVGFFVFCIYIFLFIKSGNIMKKRIPIIGYMPLAYMLIYTQSIQLINPYELMLPFIVTWMSIRIFSENI